MTLIEVAVVVLLLAMAVFLLMGWTEQLRQHAKRDLAMHVLSKLDQALARYHRAYSAYPPGTRPDPCASAVAAMLHSPRTRAVLNGLPPSVWAQERAWLSDPWGTPLRYLSAESESEYVLANQGRPVFVSAGPDRDFGDAERTRIGDNLRSDDPGPERFRPLTGRPAGQGGGRGGGAGLPAGRQAETEQDRGQEAD